MIKKILFVCLLPFVVLHSFAAEESGIEIIDRDDGATNPQSISNFSAFNLLSTMLGSMSASGANNYVNALLDTLEVDYTQAISAITDYREIIRQAERREIQNMCADRDSIPPASVVSRINSIDNLVRGEAENYLNTEVRAALGNFQYNQLLIAIEDTIKPTISGTRVRTNAGRSSNDPDVADRILDAFCIQQ